MPPASFRSLALVIGGILAGAIILWVSHNHRQTRAELTVLMAERTSDHQKIDRLTAELAAAHARVETLSTIPPAVSPAPLSPERAAAEEELDAWFGRVDALRDFLGAHPELLIPEIATASQLDWLDVTKRSALRTEADFRQAAYELRTAAKRDTMRPLRKAMQAFLHENRDIPLTDISQLLAHLPEDFDTAILNRYQISAELPPGWPANIGDKPATVVLFENPSDPLWDDQYLIGNNGLSMARPVGAKVRRAVDQSIATYTETHGAAPTRFADIASSIPPDIAPDLAAEFFEAKNPPR